MNSFSLRFVTLQRQPIQKSPKLSRDKMKIL